MTATLLVDPGDLDAALGAVAEGERTITVEGEAYRHLFKVRRLQVGQALRVVDGHGRARAAEVAEVTKTRATVRLGDEAPSLEPTLQVELWVALLRPERAAWLVEKATELGVRRVVWLETERTQRHFNDRVLERQRRIARSAVEQCGRARLAEIAGPLAWSEVEERLEGKGAAFLLDPLAEERLAAIDVQAAAPVRLLIGPEGGWSDDERERLAELGVRRVGLGETVLRVETAAVVAAGLLLS